VKINDHEAEVDHRFKINDLASRVQINMRAYARAEKFFRISISNLINSKRSTDEIIKISDHLIDRSSSYKITSHGDQLKWIFEDRQSMINDHRGWIMEPRSTIMISRAD